MNVRPPEPGQIVHLQLRDSLKTWVSPGTFEWNGKRYVSTTSGLPLSSLLDVVGWFEGKLLDQPEAPPPPTEDPA